MPTVETQIWMALRESVELAAGSLPVSWPGEVFNPPVTPTGVLPFLSVGDTQTAQRVFTASDAPHQYTGILTVSYVAAIGYNTAWYKQRASGLLEYFKPNGIARYQDVCLRWGNGLAVPRLEQGYRDDGYFRTPVIIPWRSSRVT